MDFIKVVSTEGDKVNEKYEEYGLGDGVKNQLDLIPVSGTVPELFPHILNALEEYQEHIYKVKLSHRVKKHEEQWFLIEPSVNSNLPEEYKGVVFEQVYFSSIIHAARSDDLTYFTPELHQCEVHCLTIDPKIMPVK